jgi:hypothetical protein
MRSPSLKTVYRAIVLVATAIGGLVGHETGDFLVQGDRDARWKQQHNASCLPHVRIDPRDARSPEQRTRDAHVALARHASTYALAQALTKAGLYRSAGVRVPLVAQVLGAILAAVLHAVVDDGRILYWFACWSKKLGFYELAAGGINGRALLDQATHKGLGIPLAAVFTTALASAIMKSRELRAVPVTAGC